MSMSKSATGEKPTGLTHELKFSVGQLAAAMIGIPEDDPRHNVIGRVTHIDGENVTLAKFGGEQIAVTVANLKQAVHYDKSQSSFIREGSRGEVYGLDHPDPLVGPNQWITTSVVLRLVKETGFFETRNTVYMANYVDVVCGKTGGIQRIDSPLLNKVHKT